MKIRYVEICPSCRDLMTRITALESALQYYVTSYGGTESAKKALLWAATTEKPRKEPGPW